MSRPFPRDQLRRRSKLLLHWRAADVGTEDPRNASTAALTPIKPLTGQSVTFTRASEATAKDISGNTYTVGHSQPAWSWVDGEPGVYVRASATGRSVESVEVTFNKDTLKDHTGYVALSTPDGFPTGDSTKTFLHWGNDATTNVSAQAFYYATGTTVSATDLIEVRWYCSSSGALDLGVALNGGTEIAGVGSVSATGVNTTPSAELWIGSRGTADTSDAVIKTVKIAAGEYTMQQIREAF